MGVPGIEEKYGCAFKDFSPINDGGGPLTVDALLKGDVQVANIYTTSPAIAANDLVSLEDPENNFVAQQVLPLVNDELVSDKATEVLNQVSAKLTTEDLIELNTRVSGDEKADPAAVAGDWVEENL
ncbi:hypothetical protein JR346_09535 [Rothia sp. ZJ932]|nr:hypothetical protein [Rothia sp. ZJ1223]QRZ61448.1 hypothetical protein JR346_09535 [Rothia sp. ZJ932]